MPPPADPPHGTSQRPNTTDGRRPHETGPTQDPDRCAEEHEAALFADPSARRAAGRFYTPGRIADRLIARLGERASVRPALTVDPACGTGALLLAAVRHWMPDPSGQPREARLLLAHSLRGADTDGAAIAIARARLARALHLDENDMPRHGLRVADGLDAALIDDTAAQLPRWILLNPPFGNAIRKETARDEHTRSRLQARFPEAAIGAFDRAWVFVARAQELAGPQGHLGLILPRAFASAPSARALRMALETTHGLTHLETLPPDCFRRAQVSTVLACLTPRTNDAGTAPTPPTNKGDGWALRLSAKTTGVPTPPADAPTLGAHLTVRACATAGEAYPLRDRITEAPAATRPSAPGRGDDRPGLRLLTTGAIEPGLHTWESRPQRYLGRTLQRPVIDPEALPSGRIPLQQSAKVLVAGLSRVLEAFTDTTGAFAGSVAVIAVTTPQQGSLGFAAHEAHRTTEGNDHGPLLPRVEAWLNGSLARTHYQQLQGPRALGGGSVPVTKKPLAALPIPAALGGPGSCTADDCEQALRSLARTLDASLAAATWKALPDEDGWSRLLGAADDLAEVRDPVTLRGVLDRIAGQGAATPEQAAQRRLRMDAVVIALARRDGWTVRAR